MYDYPTGFSCWDEQEREALQRVIKSDQYTIGPETEAFEHEFAEYHGRKHGVMVNSGSSANLLAVEALCNIYPELFIMKSPIVSIPAIAWSTTYAPFVQRRFQLVLADADKTWNVDIERVLDNNYDVVVLCSILGNPTHYKELIEKAAKTHAHVIEDNCESIGARTKGARLTGTFGLMSTFSFFYSHQLSAIEGGMILTDRPEFDTILRKLRAHGWSRDTRKPQTFDEEYEFTVFGYNVRPDEMRAAVARVQLRKLERFINERCMNLGYFAGRVEELGLPIELQHRNGTPSPFGLCFSFNSKDIRAKVVEALRAESIDCRLPTGGSFRKHIYGRQWQLSDTPYADKIHETGLFLGNAPFSIEGKIEKAVQVMKKVLL